MFYNNYEKSMRQNNYMVPEDESVIKTILKVSEAYSVDDVSLEELKTVLESLEFYLPACNSPEKAYGYHDEKCNKIWGCLDELNSYQNPDSTIREKCFETFKECFDKYVFSSEVERRIKENPEKLLRTSHFYGKKSLSENLPPPGEIPLNFRHPPSGTFPVQLTHPHSSGLLPNKYPSVQRRNHAE